MLLGVLLHAASSFVPGATWMVKDSDESWQLLIGVFTVHVFRMSLFFALAGFFAHMLLRKRGVRQFIRNRSARIALPLVAFLPFLIGGMVVVGLWAASYADAGPFAGGPQPAVEATDVPTERGGLVNFVLFNLPWVHLWFLVVLLWLYAAALALVGLTRVVDRRGYLIAAIDQSLKFLAASHLLPFFLAGPLFGVFAIYVPWTETGGIPAPDGGLIPNLQAAVGYGTAFGFGWFLHRQTNLLDTWRSTWVGYIVVALVLTAICARVMGIASTDPSFLSSVGSWRWVLLFCYPLAIWTWCIGLLGLVTRYLSKESRRLRYLSDASYWIYLIHLPVIGALQVLVAPVALAWELKYPFVLVAGIPLLLASYRWMVRYTWIGAWLNGRRYLADDRQAAKPGRLAS